MSGITPGKLYVVGLTSQLVRAPDSAVQALAIDGKNKVSRLNRYERDLIGGYLSSQFEVSRCKGYMPTIDAALLA